MEEQDLKQIWKSSSHKEQIMLNMKQLLVDFKTGMEHRELIVRQRDRREIIAAVFGILGFAYSFYVVPNITSRIGSVLGIMSLVYIIYKLRINRKSKFTIELFLPIQKELLYQKQFMIRQYKLLDSVVYWLSIPLFLANVLIVWGISKSAQPLSYFGHLVYKWEAKLAITVVLVLIFAYLGWLNKKAAKVNWRPLIKRINNIIDNLNKDDFKG